VFHIILRTNKCYFPTQPFPLNRQKQRYLWGKNWNFLQLKMNFRLQSSKVFEKLVYLIPSERQNRYCDEYEVCSFETLLPTYLSTWFHKAQDKLYILTALVTWNYEWIQGRKKKYFRCKLLRCLFPYLHLFSEEYKTFCT